MNNIFGSGYDPEFYDEAEEAIDIPDKDFRFAEVLNALVDKEVQKRVEEKFGNYNWAVEKHHEVTKENEELKKKIQYADRKREEGSVEIYKTAKADGLREAFGGHAIGDKGFVIRYQYINCDCMDCKRSGKIVALVELQGIKEEKTVRCPTCDGTGRKSRREEVITSAYIKQITTKIWNEGRSKEIDLYVKPDGFDSFEVSPDSFFKKITDAEAEIKNRQEKGKTK